jgi:hypothetical protein
VVRRAGAYGERAGQRENLAALLKGDIEKAAELRAHLVKPEARELAAEYLRAATAVALEYRFGPGAGMGAGPVDYDELTAFMGEVRTAALDAEPPPDFLAVEAIVRALYGEPHLLEPLGSEQRSQAGYTALRYQLARHRWIAQHPRDHHRPGQIPDDDLDGVAPSIE